MRTRLVRVRRRHARSIQMALLFLVVSLAVYLLTFALHLDGAEVPVSQSGPASTPSSLEIERVTEEIRFDALGGYLVELGKFDGAEAARVEAARYVRRGAAGYVLDEGKSCSVIGACYESLEEATNVAGRLAEQEQIQSGVRPILSSPVALRVTATREQITALGGAENTLRAITARMGEIAFALDSGQITKEAAVERLMGAQLDAEGSRIALEKALSTEQDPIASGFLMLVRDLNACLGDRIAASDETALSFSAKIKYNKIDMRLRHIAFLNSLGA